jgi:hypothetical protein
MNQVEIIPSFVPTQGWILGEDWFHLKFETPFPRKVLENMVVSYDENQIGCQVKFMGFLHTTQLK